MIQLEQPIIETDPGIEQHDGLDGSALLRALRALRNGDFRVRMVESAVGNTTFTVRLPLLLEPLEILEA
jgi:hypothetical protein